MTMKIEINLLETPPAALLKLANFLQLMAGSEPGAAPKPQAAATGADNAAPPPPPLAETTASDAATTSSTASTTSAASQSGAIDTADLDKNGLPWDGRIHSGSKGKNQDGSWKALRGVDKDIVPGIEAELRALVGNSAAAGNTAAAASTSTASPAQDADDAPPPPPPLTDDVPPPPPVEGGVTFGDVFKHVTALQKHADGNKLPQELLNQALDMVGLASMAEFMKNKDKAPDLMDAINLLVPGGA